MTHRQLDYVLLETKPIFYLFLFDAATTPIPILITYLQIFFTSVYVIFVYYLTSQPYEPLRIVMFVSIFILTSLVAQSVGLLIGAGLSLEAGVFFGPVSTIPTVLFSGFFVNFETIPRYLYWLTYISYMRFSFEGKSFFYYMMLC